MSTDVRIEVEHRADPSADPLVLRDGWKGYSIESSMMQAADSFTIDLVPYKDLREWFSGSGHKISIYAGDTLQLTGTVDSVSYGATAGGMSLSVRGRDYAGMLVDGAAPMLSYRNLTLKTIAERLISPWAGYITEIITDNAGNRYRVAGKTHKRQIGKSSPYYAGISTERHLEVRSKPGERVWDRLIWLCKQVGSHAWMTADGKLVLARPDYDQESPYPKLYLKVDDNGQVSGSNVKSMSTARSHTSRHGVYVVTGQGKPSASAMGKSLAEHYAKAKDPSSAFFWDSAATSTRIEKISVSQVGRTNDAKLARRIARTLLEEKAAMSATMKVEVPGHRMEDGGPMWAVDTMADVEFGPLGIDAPYYVIGRSFNYNLGGQSTSLTMIPPRIWLYLIHDDTSDADYLSHLQKLWEIYKL